MSAVKLMFGTVDNVHLFLYVGFYVLWHYIYIMFLKISSYIRFDITANQAGCELPIYCIKKCSRLQKTCCINVNLYKYNTALYTNFGQIMNKQKVVVQNFKHICTLQLRKHGTVNLFFCHHLTHSWWMIIYIIKTLTAC